MPCFFSVVRLRARCSRTSCTLRSSFSSFSAFAVCSLASHLFASKKSSVQDVQPSTTSVVLFSLSGCACVAHVLRVRSATHARLSRFSTLALRLIISLFQTRSAPRPRLSRLLPFALWQDTSLQAKKQCSRRTTKHSFGCAFFFVRLWARCSRTFVRFAPCPSSTCAPCSAFGQRLARDNNSATHARLSRFSAFALRLLVSCCCQAVARCSRTFCTLRASFSSFSALAVCSLASHLFASKKAVFKTYNKSTAICRAF